MNTAGHALENVDNLAATWYYVRAASEAADVISVHRAAAKWHAH